MNLTKINLENDGTSLDKNMITLKGPFDYYHYGCDNVNDEGWGCGYRTLQLMCSWFKYNCDSLTNVKIPSIIDIQKALVEMEDKPKSFINSREWIGSVEVGLVIDKLFEIPCRILHLNSIEEFDTYFNDILKHFLENGSPVMMGGDMDCSSKCIVGVHKTNNTVYLLIVDPHCRDKHLSQKQLFHKEWISWHDIRSLSKNSFYNLCLPQSKLITLALRK